MSVIVYIVALRFRKHGGPDYLGLCLLNAIYGARSEIPALHNWDTWFLNHILLPLLFSHDHLVREWCGLSLISREVLVATTNPIIRSVALCSASSHRFLISMSASLIEQLAKFELISSIVLQSLHSVMAIMALTM